ncbi:unnamed protein product [Rhizophagus irregularis]|uniref:Uncharacterized protein n=1 Tax=Rhizophagus irregularis TaxID=588596 RepID=A0A2N1NMC3_9GLOM|nr:hypothetical protein RhiirC2_819322 [Rhizophagus irregularis]CAB4391339.1 unnamed protein product [Rhizophagus irregularis]CAB5378439.1 unnamed protein product [Rhizophagus irregularis]
MVTHNSSNNFGDNVYESSQTIVAQTYDTYLPAMPVTYCNSVNNAISDQQLMMPNTISPNQQPNVSSPNHNQRYQQPNVPSSDYDANYSNAISNYSNNVTTSPDQQTNVSSPNLNQRYQQHNVASPNQPNQQQYDAINNVTISSGRQPMSSNNVTTSSDQQTNVSSSNHNQQYKQHNVASPNHQQQYDTNYQQYISNYSNYGNNATISPGRQPIMSNNNATTSLDQRTNVSSPNLNQQYQQHNVASPNHRQQYDANHQQYIHQTAISDNTDSFIFGLNHHHNYQQPSDNNHHNSNNTNHNNNQESSSNNDSPSPSLNITINSPQTNLFIISTNSGIQQVLSFLNNPSSRSQR